LNNQSETSKYQGVWESLTFQKGYCLESQSSYNPMIFFVITGSLSIEINNDITYPVASNEMFMTPGDHSFGITMLEQTHLIICHVTMDAWFVEQRWIDQLVNYNKNIPKDFYKLPVKIIIIRYLSLLDTYLREAISPPYFFELKRQELFFLLFYYYPEDDLAQFLQTLLSYDIQFKKFVISNRFNARNVRELARLANYSTSGFIKKFQKCFSDSPYKWMQKQKAKQISSEINRGVKSLQEIANEYKFSSFQHFSVFCKTHLGSPPTEIKARKKIMQSFSK